ncbi:hypothetical protein M9H77_30606 [Catharanthus roseus]|uniref:Uncharacterized protein n=1 Tax=Catharanthus roseus TaxID=4058 RepID=A0ACB9ZYK6_CATRO|nr:hypothetical protein M9H77_30606 [Catharanthus roseus]
MRLVPQSFSIRVRKLQSPQFRSYEHNLYDCYESKKLGARDSYNDISCKLVPRNDVRNGGNYVNMDESMGVKVESLLYFYCVREEEKFQFVLKSLSYELKVWWDCKCEHTRRMRDQPIKTWSLMKQSLRNKFGAENCERKRQGQEKRKIMQSSMGEKSTKANNLSQAQGVIDRKIIHHEKKNTCTFVKEEKSRKEKVESVVSAKENHASSFGEVNKMEYFKFIHFENLEALATNSKKFGVKRLVFDPRRLDLKLGPMTRAQRKKLKLQRDSDIISYKEDTLKSLIAREASQVVHNAFKCQGAIKGTTCGEKLAKSLQEATLPPMAVLPQQSLVGFCWHH